MKIWFLTRSLYPYQKTGGGQIRLGQVNELKKLGWEVTVIMPNYTSAKIIKEKDIVQIPFLAKQKIVDLLERIGIYEDYLDGWIKKAYEYLKNKIQHEDIVFATSGGELGMIKLGSLLKDQNACKFVVNFHDPIAYSLVNGLKLDNKFHVNREKYEKKYLENVDLIITSSQSNAESLKLKYPLLSSNIFCNYFGYITPSEISLHPKKRSQRIKIAYVGNMSKLQSPEILYKAYKRMKKQKDIELYFIGNFSNYEPIKSIVDKNVNLISYLSHDEFLKYMLENIDIGFVSLANDYLGACVPSKIFEYINLGLPIIGALPKGDGVEIINKNNYGKAFNYNEIDKIAETLDNIVSGNGIKVFKQNLLNDRENWKMSNLIQEANHKLILLSSAKNDN